MKSFVANAAGPHAGLHAGATTFSVANMLKVLYRWLWLFAVTFLVFFFSAVIYILTATPYFRATTVVQVEQAEQRIFNTDRSSDAEDLRREDIIRTIEQNLQSPKLFISLALDPKINQDTSLAAGFTSGTDPMSPGEIADKIQNNTHVQLRRGTRLIDVSVDHPVPAVAQKLSRALVDEYVSSVGKTQTNTTATAAQRLQEDSANVKKNLQKSEDALATYREALLLKDRITDQQRIIDALQERYRDKHPTLIQARTLLDKLTLDFDNEVQKIRTNSRLEAGYWADDDAALDGLSVKDRVKKELQLVEARTNVLDLEVETERALFNNIRKQKSEATVSQESAPTQITVVGEPYLPRKPVKPQKVLILVLGVVAGTVAGLGMVFFINGLDSSFKTPDDVEQFLGLPVVGAVPEIVVAKKAKSRPIPIVGKEANVRENIVLMSDPGGMAAEAFRSLRASLGLLGKAEDHRTLMFTSALAAEGKTFTSCNYAASLAQQGMKILLIDADLRAPAVHTFFNLPNDKGLVDHVSKGTPLADSLHANIIPNLDVLLAGNRCPNPAEFLAGAGFTDTLTHALTKYDRVIIDCSPINLVSDPLLIVSHIQSIVLVIRAARTPRRESQQALITLERAGAHPVGIVMNAIPEWTHQSYFPYSGKYSGNNKYYQAYDTGKK